MTSLAFSIYSGKGIYAVLIGSGMSRAAEIPTGWEVTIDLVRQIAATEHENCEPDPESWYISRFGESPDYSVLLERLARTSAERTTVLASYFEPSETDRENGRKLPTKAHQQLAKMASKGYIRVIVTTNFDRLMEQALEAEGVVPTVISSVDAIKGAMPLQHAACTLLKLHGDYRDTRFRNTEKELASYPGELNLLLDRILDEYGILVCGWSATWDHALRAAFFRSPNRRFTTVWTSREQPSAVALDLITFRQPSLIEISSADDFFSGLGNKVEALEKYHAQHPLSIELAITTTKRFLSKPEFRIELTDLVTSEVKRQFTLLNEDTYLKAQSGTSAEYGEALKRIEQSLGSLLGIITTGILFGQGFFPEIWKQVVIRMSDLVSMRGGTSLAEIRRYPAALLFYAAGVAACVVGDYGLLRMLFTSTTSIELDANGAKTPILTHLNAIRSLSGDNLNKVMPRKVSLPESQRMFDSLRGHFLAIVPNDRDYEEVFDRFEYLLALSYVRGNFGRTPRTWAPLGRFADRNRYYGQHVSQLLNEERIQEGEEWGPIVQGLFNTTDYLECNAIVQAFAGQVQYL